ncbi:hypothetical protein Golax_008979 [Gossypium laxum]|uniref:Uncharacterized protein n=1 Tax=Gossypium laxum TaxID=34288 RepID=A0A7J9AD47_9ROSI|nr:hypothetical protein [Gossypium laxum]
MYEKSLAITQLIGTLKFDRVGHHVALPRLEFFPPMYARIRAVGKTTFVLAGDNKIKESKLFDDVAMAIVFETLDVGEIQYTIADSLGITFERRTREGKGLYNASLDIVEVVMKVAKK